MKYYKPLVKSFSDEVLFVLEQQKQDANFSKYIRTILTERYLDESVTITSLIKKFKNISVFQTDLLWDTISLKLTISPIIELKQAYDLIEHMPIDYLVRITQNCKHESLKEYAKIVCYNKQLELEEELGIDKIDYEKYKDDEASIKKKRVKQVKR